MKGTAKAREKTEVKRPFSEAGMGVGGLLDT